jgi:hypothetical protein
VLSERGRGGGGEGVSGEGDSPELIQRFYACAT